MSNTSPDFGALIGSRICHDLISPIGAINNGLELMGMSATTAGPELSLISESVENASARIRFFRLAFGAAGEQQVPSRELRQILADVSRGGKIAVHWGPDGPVSRTVTRVVLLAEQCLESAMPYGGEIEIEQDDTGWTLRGIADKFRIHQKLWTILDDGEVPADIAPGDVHFALLALHCQDEGRRLHTDLGQEEISIRF